MDLLSALLLSVVQGITEFLPISSSGHLVLAHHLLGWNTTNNLAFGTVLHLGTAASIILIFRDDILALIRDPFGPDPQLRREALSYSGLIILATIPAAVIGIMFKDTFEQLFSNPKAAASMLLVTAALLFLSSLRKNPASRLGLFTALAIGVAQAIAIVPGISRSGSTIAMALIVGVSRKEAGKFSFLLGLIAILGAGVLQAKDITSIDVPWSMLIAGFVASFIVGVLALKILLGFVRQGKLHYFGIYCVVVGVLGIAFL